MVAGIYIGVVTSALITEWIGIHFIFGAFLFGAVMPKNAGLTRELAEKTEDFVLVFLLPVFFAYSGLKTQVGLLNTSDKWLLCAAVIGVAILGKYVGTYIAARVSGIEKREASALGWLMNTRGLTELIVLNIGLELKVISPLLFTMLVIMALVTTFMTSPLLEWVYPKRLIRLDVAEVEPEPEHQPIYRILVPVANPKTQKGLLRLALAIAGPQNPASVTPLSLVELQEDYAFASTPVEANRLIAQQQKRLQELIQTIDPPEDQQIIHPMTVVSADVARKTAEVAEINQMNLIIVGWHRPVFDKNRLGGRVGKILSTARTDVAVFVDRGIQQFENLLVPYATNIHDDLGLELALRLLLNLEQASLTVLHVNSDSQPTAAFSREFSEILAQLPKPVQKRIIQASCMDSASAIEVIVEHSSRSDLTIAGTSRAWGLERQTLGRYTDALANQCQSSLLITRKYSQVSSLHLRSVFTKNQPIVY
jgi:nucleotide-binding universal stress UspA family protein